MKKLERFFDKRFFDKVFYTAEGFHLMILITGIWVCLFRAFGVDALKGQEGPVFTMWLVILGLGAILFSVTAMAVIGLVDMRTRVIKPPLRGRVYLYWGGLVFACLVACFFLEEKILSPWLVMGCWTIEVAGLYVYSKFRIVPLIKECVSIPLMEI